jgi:superfamily II DNA or RNA helicase
MSRTLHTYQEQALDALRRSLRPGSTALLHLATGGGKTCVGNAFVAEHLAGSRQNVVVWVTKDWTLLDQAFRDLSEHHPEWAHEARRIGYPRAELALGELPEGERGRVHYTTLQTLQRRHSEGRLRHLRPSLVVWDECHWADSQPLGRVVRDLARRAEAALLGLTATPRSPEWSIFKHDPTYSMPFSRLVELGYLARPDVVRVRTNLNWAPLFGSHGDVKESSLQELADSPARNQRILATYRQSPEKWGKTLVFACNIEHAEALATLFQRAGVPSEVLHSQVDDPSRALERFRRGAVRLMVNVAMMTHGVDIPSIRTVFLCRPTASDTLFMQMVGRGARLDPDDTLKRSFHIVEFNDSVDLHGDRFVTTDTRFGGPPTARGATTSLRGPRVDRHTFDSEAGALRVPVTGDVPAELHELWYRQKQTFGVEIELTRDGWEDEGDASWFETAERLRTVLLGALGADLVCDAPAGYGGGKTDAVWNVERDGSCGWEITSRILEGEPGLRELADACQALDAALARVGLRVAHQTGLHVHLAWRDAAGRGLPRMLRLARLFEPALATLVAPSRLRDFDGSRYSVREPNLYARPVSAVFPARTLAAMRDGISLARHAFEDEDAKYTTFNIRPLESKGTVEVRMHSGTTEIAKIAMWTSLWMQLLWEAEHGTRPVPEVPDVELILPNADILALAETWLPDGTSKSFRERLAQRRGQIVRQWQEHPDLHTWLPYAEAWGIEGLEEEEEPEPDDEVGVGDEEPAPAAVARAFEDYALAAPGVPTRAELEGVVRALELLEQIGALRNVEVKRAQNGWGVVSADRREGHGPILHIWQKQPLRVWVYRRMPRNTGYSEGAHFELTRPTEADILSELRPLL